MKEIMVYTERCNGCLTCVLACAAAHSGAASPAEALAAEAPGRLFIQAVSRRPVPVLCRHCEEPACVAACMTGAMQKDPDTGIVTNEGHEQTCVGCWMCIMACPYGAIVPQPGLEKKAIKCDRCPDREVPACVAACPNQALVFEDPGDFAIYRRQMAAAGLVEKAGESR